jgi:hypothetical protein
VVVLADDELESLGKHEFAVAVRAIAPGACVARAPLREKSLPLPASSAAQAYFATLRDAVVAALEQRD